MREREDVNRNREAGCLDEIQGVVENTLDASRGAVMRACNVFIGFLSGSVSGFIVSAWIEGQNALGRVYWTVKVFIAGRAGSACYYWI